MKKLTLATLLTLGLLFMAISPSHAAPGSGTYIDCVHGCSNQSKCKDCCDKAFSDVLLKCKDSSNRNFCLGQDYRAFDCPYWQPSTISPVGSRRSECKECHEDDR